MKRLAILIVFSLALVTVAAGAQQLSIAYVNGQRLQQDSKRAQRAAEALRQEFAARERELSGMRDKVAGMQAELSKPSPGRSAQEMERMQREFTTVAQRFEQARRAFEEDIARRKAEERAKFLNALQVVVDKIAKARKFDIVLFQAVYASPAMDITNQVMKDLDGS